VSLQADESKTLPLMTLIEHEHQDLTDPI